MELRRNEVAYIEKSVLAGISTDLSTIFERVYSDMQAVDRCKKSMNAYSVANTTILLLTFENSF